MIVQIKLQLSKCTRLVQCDVKIWFDVEDRKTHVYRLKKALYGLKQAPRAWYGRIDSFLTSLRFTNSKVDSNLCFKVMNDEPVILLLYVDDLFLTEKKSSSPIVRRSSLQNLR
jgi:hypothetical protein